VKNNSCHGKGMPQMWETSTEQHIFLIELTMRTYVLKQMKDSKELSTRIAKEIRCQFMSSLSQGDKLPQDRTNFFEWCSNNRIN